MRTSKLSALLLFVLSLPVFSQCSVAINPVTKRLECAGGAGASGALSAPLGSFNGTDFFGTADAISKPGALSSWSNHNIGSTTVTQVNGTVQFVVPGTTSGDVRGYIRTAPATPYTVIGAFRFAQSTLPTTRIGIGFRESATSKMVYCGPANGGSVMQVVNYTNNTTGSSTPYTQSWYNGTSLIWVKLVADGTNLTYYVSFNGIAWLQLYTSAKNAFFTTAPDQIGFFFDMGNGTSNGGVLELTSFSIS